LGRMRPLAGEAMGKRPRGRPPSKGRRDLPLQDAPRPDLTVPVPAMRVEPSWVFLSDDEFREFASKRLGGSVMPALLGQLGRRELMALMAAHDSVGGTARQEEPQRRSDLATVSSKRNCVPAKTEVSATVAQESVEDLEESCGRHDAMLDEGERAVAVAAASAGAEFDTEARGMSVGSGSTEPKSDQEEPTTAAPPAGSNVAGGDAGAPAVAGAGAIAAAEPVPVNAVVSCSAAVKTEQDQATTAKTSAAIAVASCSAATKTAQDQATPARRTFVNADVSCSAARKTEQDQAMEATPKSVNADVSSRVAMKTEHDQAIAAKPASVSADVSSRAAIKTEHDQATAAEPASVNADACRGAAVKNEHDEAMPAKPTAVNAVASCGAAVKTEPDQAAGGASEGALRPLVWRSAQNAHANERPPTGISLCALKGGLATRDGAAVDIPCGELLLCLAGMHPRWTLDKHVASCLWDMLQPSGCEVPEEWCLRPHQADGYRWLMSRASTQFGCILADSMGLGKTRQAIAWMMGVRACLLGGADAAGSAQRRCGVPGCRRRGCAQLAWRRALILAPAMLTRGDESVWMKELQEASALWQTELRVWQCIGERTCNFSSVVNVGTWRGPMVELYDVVVTSYESFLANQDMFCSHDWSCVILDEAQCIKRHAAQTSIVTKRLAKCPHRLALTGTPVENSLDDLHSILEFIQPDAAGSLKEFRQRFQHDEAALARLLRAVALRREPGRLVAMVPKEDLEVPVRLSAAQEMLYGAVPQNMNALKRFRALELICTHPWCFAELADKEVRDALPERFLRAAGDQQVAESGKMDELFRILRGLLAQGDKVLVFFCRTITSRLLSALIEREFGDRAGIIRGDTELHERERVLQAFRAEQLPGVPPMQVLLLSVWVGSLGLNLPEARWVVHFERVWNPAREMQATSRAHRISSRLPVKAYSLYTEGTVEGYKCNVLSRKRALSSQIARALDADLEAVEGGPYGDEAEGELPAVGVDASACALRDELFARAVARDPRCLEDREATCAASETDDSDVGDRSGEEQVDADDQIAEDEEEEEDEYVGSLPTCRQLRPKRLVPPFIGKYGDPQNVELWAWYVEQGHREVHPKAPTRSTAGLQQHGCDKPQQNSLRRAKRLAAQPCRVHDPRERGDVEVTVALGGGVECRLFIPQGHLHHFEGVSGGGSVRLVPPGEGAAPFPVFTPSLGRAASDTKAGLLDLTPTMVGAEGERLDFLQIVAVKPSEVEKYRASAPFFVVMELPRQATVDHPSYGQLAPEDLGIGCSRHWLLRLADALAAPYVFMLDDSVSQWKSDVRVFSPGGLRCSAPGQRIQLRRVSLGCLFRYFAEPRFLEEEMPRLSVLGFARYRPEMGAWRLRCLFRRSHVYSAFLVNVRKVLHEQGVNFRQELYVWEDLRFNLDVGNVCKCYFFSMLKHRFSTGGCSPQVAHSPTPIVVCNMYHRKKTPEEVVAEAFPARVAEITKGDEVGAVAQREVDKGHIVGDEGSAKKRKKKAAIGNVDPRSAVAACRDLMRLEDHPALTPQGAVSDESGTLLASYYKALAQPFRDREGPLALVRPGFRKGESPTEGMRMWDDMRRKSNHYANIDDVHGAGWIAAKPTTGTGGPDSKWFNIKIWGSWRYVFLLARLQRAVWEERLPPQPPVGAAALDGGQACGGQACSGHDASAAVDRTPTKRRQQSAEGGTAVKKRPGRQPAKLSTKAASSNASTNSVGATSVGAGVGDLFSYFSPARCTEKLGKQGNATQTELKHYFGARVKREAEEDRQANE